MLHLREKHYGKFKCILILVFLQLHEGEMLWVVFFVFFLGGGVLLVLVFVILNFNGISVASGVMRSL